MYDIFFLSTSSNLDEFNRLKDLYPRIQLVKTPTSFAELKNKSFTKMFWVIYDDLILSDGFSLNEYKATKWDDTYVHVFKNGKHYDGICLFPKHLTISQREFHHRFFTDKKEIDIVASIPKKYDIFNISTYNEYLEAVNNSTTEMFWAVWPDVIVDKNFNFDYSVPKHNSEITHIFKNADYFDGICIFSKTKLVSKREFHHRFFTDKKEIDIVASIPKKYNVYTPYSYEEYQIIKDEIFWLVWPEVTVTDNTVFDLYFSHHNSYDRRENHVFKNLCNDDESYLSGIILCSKYKPLSKREFEKQYAVDKKEHNQIVSRYKYNQYVISTFEEYNKILETETQPLFWCIYPEIQVTDESIFNLYFDPNDGKYDYDRNINQVFLHKFQDNVFTYNGLMLLSTKSPISKREFDFRYPIQKKENELIVSTHRLYDIVFISYNEPTADENFENLRNRFPRAKRIHGVRGIHQAHIKAAELAETEMFWVVDGDAIITDNFDFSHVVSRYDLTTVQVWRSQNPINDLVYGYGGVKLLPRKLTLNMDVTSTDMTTSISDLFRIQTDVSNITAFNTDPFNTWKSAFRECVKLASQSIVRQDIDETILRLDTWCSVGADKPFGEYAISGAIAGREFGNKYKDDSTMLSKINDFDWLKQQYGI